MRLIFYNQCLPTKESREIVMASCVFQGKHCDCYTRTSGGHVQKEVRWSGHGQLCQEFGCSSSRRGRPTAGHGLRGQVQ